MNAVVFTLHCLVVFSVPPLFGWIVLRRVFREANWLALIPGAAVLGLAALMAVVNEARFFWEMRIAVWSSYKFLLALSLVIIVALPRRLSPPRLPGCVDRAWKLGLVAAAAIGLGFFFGIPAFSGFLNDAWWYHYPTAIQIQTVEHFPLNHVFSLDDPLYYHYGPDILAACWSFLLEQPVQAAWGLTIAILAPCTFLLAFALGTRLTRNYWGALVGALVLAAGGNLRWLLFLTGKYSSPIGALRVFDSQTVQGLLQLTFTPSHILGVPLALTVLLLFRHAASRPSWARGAALGLTLASLTLVAEWYFLPLLAGIGLVLAYGVWRRRAVCRGDLGHRAGMALLPVVVAIFWGSFNNTYLAGVFGHFWMRPDTISDVSATRQIAANLGAAELNQQASANQKTIADLNRRIFATQQVLTNFSSNNLSRQISATQQIASAFKYSRPANLSSPTRTIPVTPPISAATHPVATDSNPASLNSPSPSARQVVDDFNLADFNRRISATTPVVSDFSAANFNFSDPNQPGAIPERQDWQDDSLDRHIAPPYWRVPDLVPLRLNLAHFGQVPSWESAASNEGSFIPIWSPAFLMEISPVLLCGIPFGLWLAWKRRTPILLLLAGLATASMVPPIFLDWGYRSTDFLRFFTAAFCYAALFFGWLVGDLLNRPGRRAWGVGLALAAGISPIGLGVAGLIPGTLKTAQTVASTAQSLSNLASPAAVAIGSPSDEADRHKAFEKLAVETGDFLFPLTRGRERAIVVVPTDQIPETKYFPEWMKMATLSRLPLPVGSHWAASQYSAYYRDAVSRLDARAVVSLDAKWVIVSNVFQEQLPEPVVQALEDRTRFAPVTRFRQGRYYMIIFKVL